MDYLGDPLSHSSKMTRIHIRMDESLLGSVRGVLGAGDAGIPTLLICKIKILHPNTLSLNPGKASFYTVKPENFEPESETLDWSAQAGRTVSSGLVCLCKEQRIP